MEPEPEPEQLALPDSLLPPSVVDREAVTARARARSAAGHVHAARRHMEAAATADRHNLGGPQYALAIESLECALRVDPQAEWADGRHAAVVLHEAREKLGERERERDDATVAAAATASAAGGLLERAVGEAASWLQLSGWNAGARFAAPEPCELTLPPAAPVQGHLAVTSSCLEFQRLANPTDRPIASSFKRLWNGGGGSNGSSHALAIPLGRIVNCFERSEPARPSLPGMPPPIALPPSDLQSDGEGPTVMDGYVEAPEEQRAVVVTYSAGLEGTAMQLEATLTLSASAAENLLATLEPIVERFHAARLDSNIGSAATGSDTHTVYERVYFQCEVDGQGALDSGVLQVNQTTTSRGAGCGISFEGSFHTLSIQLGVTPDMLGGSAGELLHVRVRDDVPEIRGRQTVHVVHQPAGSEESITVEWLLDPDEAVSLCAQLSPYIGTVVQIQERFSQNAARHARAKAIAANVEDLLESVPAVLAAARDHGEAGRYAMASAMLTLELLKMHRVIEEWRSLGYESSSGAEFSYESTEEKQFEALGHLFSSAGTLEAQYSEQGRHRMQVWGMLSDQNLHVGDVWRPGLYVLDGSAMTRYNTWEPQPEHSFSLSSVFAVSLVTSTPKSTFEVVATLGLDGMKNDMPDNVLAVKLVHHQEPDVIDDVVGAATALLVGDDGLENIGCGKTEEEAAAAERVGVGRELTDRTNELFARVSEEGDWSAESRAEAMRLSQNHLQFGESNASSAAGADRYGLGGPQWALAADAFRNALRLRPSDDRWAGERESGCAARALAEAEAGAISAEGGSVSGVAEPTAPTAQAPVERVLRAPDKASFDIWKVALTPISADVFAVQSFPIEELSLHLYKVDRSGGGGRGHWGGGGGSGKKLSPGKSGPRPPREDRGWITRECRLFPSAICFHEEAGGQLGRPVGVGVDLWQVVRGSVHVVPAVSAPREHYGRVGAVLSMVVVVPPVDDGDGNFASGSAREVCIASSDEVVVEQWESAVLEQLDKRPELPVTEHSGHNGTPQPVQDDETAGEAPAVAAPCISIGAADGDQGQDRDRDEEDEQEVLGLPLGA